MYIDSLDILNFRNIRQACLEFSPGFNVFYGANGQGKSNLLEAVYALSFLKGFREERVSDLISFGEQKAQISTRVKSGASTTRLSLEFHSSGRRAFMDGMPCTRIRDYLGTLRAILFVPMDVAFLQGAPAERRKMLDRMVFNLRPAYLIDLEQYQKISKQKSAVLHQDSPDTSLLDVYDEQMLPIATRIIEARYDFLSLLSPYIRRVFSAIFEDEFVCLPCYKSAVLRDPIVFDGSQMGREEVVRSWLSSQKNARAKELMRRQIAPGPHRDDWSIELNRRSAKLFASQGQQRAMSLAIKMAEIECLHREADVEPVFLLDDVSSELDPIRHKRLFEYLNQMTAQTFLTTTAREHVHIENVSKMFHVENGSIENAC